MKEPIKILFIAQEFSPFVPETSIAKLTLETSQYMLERGCEIRNFMPCYGQINKRRNQLHEVQRLSGMNLIIEDTDHPLIIKVASIQSIRMQVYFIDNDDYFYRKGMVADEHGKEFADNGERMIFFVRGVLETITKLCWTPDVIHCHGWISALAPLYIKKAFKEAPFFRDAKIVYSIYNNGFATQLPSSFGQQAQIDGLSSDALKPILGKTIDYTTLTKFAMQHADAVIAAEPGIDDGFEAYAQTLNVPFLPYSDKLMKNYLKFVGQIYPPFGKLKA